MREAPRDYFDLQLRFAESMAEACGYGLAHSLVPNTNFHRRFALGDWRADAVHPFWTDYLSAMEKASGHEARLDVTCDFFSKAKVETRRADERPFGCFSCAPLRPDGVVRFHFGNHLIGNGRAGPLARSRLTERREELRALFSYVRAEMPDARTVHGGSWLYNVEAYRSLFPPSYGRSRKRIAALRNFSGSSSWGQFLDHRGAVKPDLKARFLENLKMLDPENPTDTFPMPALGTQAPVGDFFSFYGV